jgi:hypothetical protein
LVDSRPGRLLDTRSTPCHCPDHTRNRLKLGDSRLRSIQLRGSGHTLFRQWDAR